MEVTTTPAGRTPVSTLPGIGRPWAWTDPRTGFAWDLQLFAGEDDDELGEAPNIDIAALSDDPAQLKGVIRQVLGDNRSVRREAGKRRTALRTAESTIASLKSEHTSAIEKLTGDHTTALRDAVKAEVDRITGEHTTALQAVTTERDTLVGERDGLKAERETLNRSNGQLRTKFREQFVDQRVRTDLEKRGVHNVEDAMKLLDVSAIEFDEEKLAVKDEAAFKTMLDTFATDRAYLFGTQRPTVRGTSPGRGSSDSTTPVTKPGEADKTLSTEQITAQVMADLGIS